MDNKLNPDNTKASACRIYDTLIGGVNLQEIDKKYYDTLLEISPGTPSTARENREFMLRASRTLAKEYGVTQFIDIGCSFPTVETPNLHDVVLLHQPEAKVFYVDIEPGIEKAWDTIIKGLPAVKYADLNIINPSSVIAGAAASEFIDFAKPVAVIITGVLPFVSDDDDPWSIVSTLRDSCSDGSFLVLSHALTSEDWPEGANKVLKMYEEHVQPMFTRLEKDVRRFFDGYTLIPPGLVSSPLWRPDVKPTNEMDFFKRAVGGVGVKYSEHKTKAAFD